MLLEISIGCLGFMVGVAITHRSWKATYNNLHEASLKALKKQHDTNTKVVYDRVRAKIKEIDRIMEAQLSLWGQVDGPNKGSSHSRWKRDLIGQINDLETEKIDIFRDILSDGVDLKVTTMSSDGIKSNKMMSAIVQEFETSNIDDPYKSKNPVVKPVKSTTKNEPNKKLRLIKESKLSLIKD